MSQVLRSCPTHQLIALLGHALQHRHWGRGVAGDGEALQPAAAAEVLGEDMGGALGEGEQEATARGRGGTTTGCYQ